MAVDMQPHSVVEAVGLKLMLKVIKPCYEVLLIRVSASKSYQAFYKQVLVTVVHDLSKASAIALTT